MEDINSSYKKIYKYLDSNYIITRLQYRYRNEEESNFIMPYTDLMNVTNIDEYMYQLMLANTKTQIGAPLYTYLREINRELQMQPTLFLSLPISKLSLNTLRKYLPNIDDIYNRIKFKNNEANKIFKMYMNNPNIVTGEELKKLLLFLTYTIPYNNNNMKNAMENLAKKLLNDPPRNVHEFYVTKFLIKFFGYKKIQEQNLKDTKLLIAGLDLTTQGLSTENFAFVTKRALQQVIMSNNNVSNREKRSTHEELLSILHTMYHEIRHQKQSQDAKNGIINDISFYMGSRNIIYSMDNNYDYNKNYWCYETEKDANIKGWEEVEKLIKTYMPSHNLERITKNILRHRLTEELEQLTGTRKDKSNRVYLSSSLLVKYLDEAFRRKPYELNKSYKQFSLFYNQNGIPKREIELLRIPSTHEFKEFFYDQVSYRSQSYDYKLRPSELDVLSERELIIVINNLKILMDVTESKLNKISDRVSKEKSFNQGIADNVINYYNYAIYLSTTANRILERYNRLHNFLTVSFAITSMNECINMINNNTLVTQIITGNQVSKVGRRR